MIVLGIESATDQVSVALGDAGGVLGLVDIARPKRHAETLAPAIEFLCRTAGVELGGVGAIAADVGPGLFTGLRVGLATATMLARALDLPTVGACSLDLLAFPLRHGSRAIAAILDARKGEVFSALYVPVPGGVQRLSEPTVGPIDAAIEELRAHPSSPTGDLICIGDGALRYAAELHGALRCEIADPFLARPSAGPLVQLAAAAVAAGHTSALEPMYLRPPDAQINWATRHTSGSPS